MDAIPVGALIIGAKLFIIVNALLVIAAYLVYFERKISAWMQNRIGPNRVGPLGLFQSFADVFKLWTKEDIVPAMVDKRYHLIAPLISMTVAMAAYAVIPFGEYYVNGANIMAVAPGIDIGILYILAMSSIGVYGITLAGWSSNNKYSLLGGLRSAAQMISYELSMGLALIGALMISGSLDLVEIVKAQSGGKWNVIFQPLGFLIFLVAAFAETNRAPFDLPEAEPELVGGYHTEYGSMKMGFFLFAEYVSLFTSSAVISVLFFGGFNFPGMDNFSGNTLALLGLVAMFAKTFFFVFVFMWIRWTLPRFRFDQLMHLGWKSLIPISLINLLITGLVVAFRVGWFN
ncbi:MAG: NADH-quinone oxidoreductase subunit NuoH [Ignavibacteria bacterium]